MQLKERFNKSFEFWSQANDGGWQDWFDRDIPAELAFPPDTEFTGDLISEMLDQGETHWNHPGWNRDLWSLLEDWSISGKLIRARLMASWLLCTLPDDPLDGDMGDRLLLLSKGDFCSVFEGESCLLYASDEHYLSTLQWGILPYISGWLARIGI